MDFSSFAFEFQWEQCFSLLEKWKLSMINQILLIYQDKYSQIQFYKDQAENELEKTQLIFNINEYFQHDCILSDEIDRFKTKLNQFKRDLLHQPLPLNIQMNIPSLENTIVISPLFIKTIFDEKNLLQNYQLPKQTIRLISTSNNQIVLVNSQSKIYLYDQYLGYIDEFDLIDYTDEYLHDICWIKCQKNFLFLCDYSLWSLENFYLNKLAEIPTKKHVLNYFISFDRTMFFIYNTGEYIERWSLNIQWKLDKRWQNLLENQLIQSVSSNNDYLLFYTNQNIQIMTNNLILQYKIELNNEHLYSDFIYLSSHQIWIFIDKQIDQMKYFHMNERVIHSLDQIFVQKISLLDNNLAIITKNHQLQIISHC